MRTLIVSDFHLGQRPGHDVLRLEEPLARLLGALDGIDRLVLLGDIVELAAWRHGPDTLRAAAPTLSAIGERMAPHGEIVLVPGNHDGGMVRSWAHARGRELGLADDVPADATETLAAVCRMLAPATVQVRYPGFWVREDVWATHGHYLDRHLVPESTFGLPRGLLRRPPLESSMTPSDYERARRRRRRRERAAHSDSLLTQLRERPLATLLEHLAELTRYGTFVLQGARLTGVTARALDLQARHAANPAMARAATGLGVRARYVVYGHIHRTGPRDGERWQPHGAGPCLFNAGSWVYEPVLLDHQHGPHPYWPGGAVLVEAGGPPQVLGLLDGLPGASLTRRPRTAPR